MKKFTMFIRKWLILQLIISLSASPTIAQTNLFTEDFEAAAIGYTPPLGWGLDVITGSNAVSFQSSGTQPTCTPFSGVRMVEFQSFSYAGYNNRLKMTTPLSTVGYTNITVDFKWLTDPGYAGVLDRVDLQYSTNGTTWSTIATINRYAATQEWTTQTIVLPDAANGAATLYIAFDFISAFGNNCHLDQMHITGISSPQQAQPQFYNYSTAGSGSNSFPFNIAAGKDVQLLYLPGDLNQPDLAPAGTITRISFLISPSYPLGPWTYTDFIIKMGQSPVTSFPAGNFYTGPLTTVYHKSSITLTAPAGSWMTLILDTPFEYLPYQSLIVEVGQCGVPGASGFSATYTTLPDNRRIWSVGGCPFAYSSANTAAYHMGLSFSTPPLFYNGLIFNSSGTGAGGTNESIYYQGGTGTYGSGCQQASGIYVADDFTVPPGKTWVVSSMDFYAYQTNSTTSSTITGAYARIWRGKPGAPGSTVFWGNKTTNRLDSSYFANVYRVLVANGGVARPIMRVVASTPGLILGEGSYWAEWACTGSIASGPWVPPIVTMDAVTGNAVQTLDNGVTYTDVLYNTFAQGFPFALNGSEIVCPFTIVQNASVPNGQTNCYNASQTISVAGNGTTFLVQNGGSAIMIAGLNIQYNPGTKVNYGGYMSGYIAPSGPYCVPFSMPSVATSGEEMMAGALGTGENEPDVNAEQSSFIKIYPNPTTGKFILELTGATSSDNVRADVYGMRGEKVSSNILSGAHKYEFSLSGCPAGIYFIRVITGERSETAKIIKQ